MKNYNNSGDMYKPQLNNVGQKAIDLKSYYRPAVKFYEILYGWKMKEEVNEDSKKSKKVQTSSQFKNNQD